MPKLWNFSPQVNFYISDPHTLQRHGKLIGDDMQIDFIEHPKQSFTFILSNLGTDISAIFAETAITGFLKALDQIKISYHLKNKDQFAGIIAINDKNQLNLFLDLLNQHFELGDKLSEIKYLCGFNSRKFLEEYSSHIIELIESGYLREALQQISLYKYPFLVKTIVTHCIFQEYYQTALKFLNVLDNDEEANAQKEVIKKIIAEKDLYFWEKHICIPSAAKRYSDKLALETALTVSKYNEYCGFEEIKIKNLSIDQPTFLYLLETLVNLYDENDFAVAHYYALKEKIKSDQVKWQSEFDYNKNLITRLRNKRYELTLNFDEDYPQVEQAFKALPRDFYSEYYIKLQACPLIPAQNENQQALPASSHFKVNREEENLTKLDINLDNIILIAEHLFAANQKKTAIRKATHLLAEQGQNQLLKLHEQQTVIKKLEKDIQLLQKSLIKPLSKPSKPCIIM